VARQQLHIDHVGIEETVRLRSRRALRQARLVRFRALGARARNGPAMATKQNGLAQVERTTSRDAAQVYVLRLYVSGASTKSLEAIHNTKKICDERLAGKYTLEVVDIYQHPSRAALDQVVAVPMLIKQRPLPLRRL